MRPQPSAKRATSALFTASLATAAAVGTRGVNTRLSGASKGKEAKEQREADAAEDRALIAMAQAGDMRAFGQLVERHQRRGFALALALVRDESDARELVQDAFLRVFKSLPTFQGDSTFYTWFYRIVTNLGIDLLRKPGRNTAQLDEEHVAGAEGDALDVSFVGRFEGQSALDVVRRREIAARLQAALDALPSYHRAVIVLREVDGLSYEEMAEVMGVSKGTIMSRLFHARQKLQRALADCYEEQVGARPSVEAPTTESGGEP